MYIYIYIHTYIHTYGQGLLRCRLRRGADGRPLPRLHAGHGGLAGGE